MSNVQDAVSAFESGFNCSEAIVRTYGPDLTARLSLVLG
jgi:hypothetical protein